MTPAKVTVDTTEAKDELDQLKIHADITAQSVTTITKKSYTSLILLADIMGIAIPEFFNAMMVGAIMAGEMFVKLAAAETVSGVLAAKAFLTFSAATMMFFRAMIISQQKREVENKLTQTLMLLNTWS